MAQVIRLAVRPILRRIYQERRQGKVDLTILQ
jgi:hypothetical protein